MAVIGVGNRWLNESARDRRARDVANFGHFDRCRDGAVGMPGHSSEMLGSG